MQQTKSLLLVIIITLFLTVACNSLSSSERERINQLADQGESFAATVAANAPEYAATAQAMASTAIAAAPTVVIDAQAAAATVASNAQLLSEQANVAGDSLLIIADRMNTRIARLQPDANGNIVFVINEAELTGAIVKEEIKTDQRFQDVAVTFDDGSILLTGNVTRPLEAPFAIVFLPYVEDGTLKLAINESSIGAIRLPRLVITRAESRINRTLTTLLDLIPGEVDITAVAVTAGAMTITATTH